jgi:hypothetical protein
VAAGVAVGAGVGVAAAATDGDTVPAADTDGALVAAQPETKATVAASATPRTPSDTSRLVDGAMAPLSGGTRAPTQGGSVSPLAPRDGWRPDGTPRRWEPWLPAPYRSAECASTALEKIHGIPGFRDAVGGRQFARVKRIAPAPIRACGTSVTDRSACSRVVPGSVIGWRSSTCSVRRVWSPVSTRYVAAKCPSLGWWRHPAGDAGS